MKGGIGLGACHSRGLTPPLKQKYVRVTNDGGRRSFQPLPLHNPRQGGISVYIPQKPYKLAIDVALPRW